MKKFVSIILALTTVFAMSVTASANEIETDGGSATTPVYLSSTEDGSIGGTPAATAMSVTVPTALPMAMSQSGDVTTATDCQIINNSFGAVRVKSVTITAGDDWSLTAFGDKSTLADEKVDANKIGFAMSIGGGAQVETDGSNADTQILISAPINGCYMSGVGNSNANYVDIDYDAIVTPLSNAVTDANVANVVFVIEWDTVA